MVTRGDPGDWFMGTEKAWDDTPAFLASVPKSGELLLTWFYGLLMAATSAMIVLGAVVERVSMPGFLFFVICFTGFIQPVVAYWLWNPHGWLAHIAHGPAIGERWVGNYNAHGYRGPAPNASDPSNVNLPIAFFQGALDYSGTAVVHMVGGCAALVATIIVGPRSGRFSNANSHSGPCTTDIPSFTHGTLHIWLGFLGFNAGAPWAGHGITTTDGGIVGLIIVNSIICPMAAGLVYLLLWVSALVPDINRTKHCIIAALVAVGCGADCMQPYAVFVLGISITPVFIGASKLCQKLAIDDPCEGIAMHYFAAVWGMVFLGLFCDPNLPSRNAHVSGLFYGTKVDTDGDESGVGALFFWQLAAICSITVWVALLSAVVLFPLSRLGLLRVTQEEEDLGLDAILYMAEPATARVRPTHHEELASTPSQTGLENRTAPSAMYETHVSDEEGHSDEEYEEEKDRPTPLVLPEPEILLTPGLPSPPVGLVPEEPPIGPGDGMAHAAPGSHA